MVPVTDEQTKLIKLETFKGIKNDVDCFRVNIFEISNFSYLNFLLLLSFGFVHSNERLVSFELLQKGRG